MNPQKYSHEAMATNFELFIQHDRELYARQASVAAFAEIDRLEAQWSRYRETSEISRINHGPVGEAVRVHPDTLALLQLADRMRNLTDGAFDLTAGSARASADGGALLAVGDALEINEEAFTVRRLRDGARLDTGGLGKGFALDRAASRLEEDWDIARFLFSSGGSTVLAGAAPIDRPGWELLLERPDEGRDEMALAHRAASASGAFYRGAHIIDPKTGLPMQRYARAWAAAPTGGEADALSTAFMLMPLDRIEALVKAHPEYAARLLIEEKGVRRLAVFGVW